MNNKVLLPALLAGIMSFGVQAQHETLQELPEGVDLSSAEITEEYLKSELGDDFVSEIFGDEVACNTNNGSISAFGEQVEFDSNPHNAFVLKAMDIEGQRGARNNIGQINSVVLDPVLSDGMYQQRKETYGEYCRKFEQPNLIQHVNANTILASWIYKNKESL